MLVHLLPLLHLRRFGSSSSLMAVSFFIGVSSFSFHLLPDGGGGGGGGGGRVGGIKT